MRSIGIAGESGAGAGQVGVTEALQHEFEALGLSPYESRALLGLLQTGSATPAKLAQLADVPRTSTYQVLEELKRKGLAERVPGEGPAVWAASDRDDVLARLEAIQEAKLLQHKARAERVRKLLAESVPAAAAPNLPFVRIVHDPSTIRPLYEQLLRGARSELLVFNKPPYSWKLGTPNPVVLETARRISTRVLYEDMQVRDPLREGWRLEMETYHAAGAQARVVDYLPVKLAVFDRTTAILSLDAPGMANVGFPTVLFVEHPGFAAVQADAFDRLWDTGRHYLGVTEEISTPARRDKPRARLA